ncbi:N-acetylmuramoyl-L-alanine amidase family protein, partial [Mediterraneibacter glycyrrhizinilyticus]|uniref:N-acetylmuramoyl-L-alanine amidase family protein n=1 Tax=Mediterraneibacter glycyrrhizinilyticus TaxID=342942 RepID=UPI0025A3824C
MIDKNEDCYIIIIIKKGVVKMGKKGKKRLVAFLLSTSLLMSLCMPVSAEEVNTSEVTEKETLMLSGWQGSLSEENRCYISENGERLTGIQTIEGKTYYFDLEGILQTGWQTVGEEQYYFSLETGERYENLTGVIDGTEYEFAADGTYTVISDPSLDDENSSASDEIAESADGSGIIDAENNQQQIHDNEIMADEEVQSNSADTDNDLNTPNSGSIRTLEGKQKIDGSYYYYKDGECLKNTWIEDGNNKYYATEDGKLHTGWLRFGSTYYYCRSNASVVYGLQYVGSDRYYFDEEGIRQESKWIDANGKRYYAMEDGKLRVGWLKTGSTYYYCSSTGALVYGLQYVGSDRYYFDEE